MEQRIVGPGPYRATRLWNETIEQFRAGLPVGRHRCRLRNYERCFVARAAVDWLLALLRGSHNFGPEVTRRQTVQLLGKFLKNHVIEDIQGRWGTEDFKDNRQLYRFPLSSPLKPYPRRPPFHGDPVKFPAWSDTPPATSQDNIPVRPLLLNSDSWFKRHSIAIGEIPACRLVQRRQLTDANVEDIWKSMTLAHLQKVLGLDSLEAVLDAKLVKSKNIIHNVYRVNQQGLVLLEDKSQELPHWVLSAMKCLANWPGSSNTKQPSYPGFEKDVFRTIADYYGHLKEPLLTFQLFDAFVSVLGLFQKEAAAVEGLQTCCLLLPPENRRKLQLLTRLMARIHDNRQLPPLCEHSGTRALIVQTFSRPILRSRAEAELDELLSARLVTFLLDHHQEILTVPPALQAAVEERLAHLRRVQIKYPGADPDTTLPGPSFCRQISPEEFEYQKEFGAQEPIAALLEGTLADPKLSVKEKRKKLKQFQKSHPAAFQERFPTPESQAAALLVERPRPPLLVRALTRPFQAFHRTRSFRV
ncbi:DEP domain-containing protein 1B isoform X1 [Ornithorhynchus anatinus]|uniref:DEP domain containing 1B n=1 Tax=Ornithorhynchus anatinus TaxID=9258 RepID=A0A6I8ND79_ORNAN|nr:DEP domain-containing protein 1B isoform X1 [Ornithorhynchus anatinus]